MSITIITGANRGIGLELTKKMMGQRRSVLALCRQASDELKELDVRVEENFDTTNSQSLACLPELLGTEKIDCLINNAGVMEKTPLGEITPEALVKQFQVNAMAPLLLTQAALNHFNDQAKAVVITSRMGSIGDNSSGGAYGYRMAKAAVNAAFASLAHDLKGRGISVGIIHPGFVQTRMTGFQGQLTPEQAAGHIAERIQQLSLADSGKFFHCQGEELPW